jgi:hypothetical protein
LPLLLDLNTLASSSHGLLLHLLMLPNVTLILLLLWLLLLWSCWSTADVSASA